MPSSRRSPKPLAECFDVEAKIRRPVDRCPSVEISSKTIVEFLEYLGCGGRASSKRIPDAVLRSPRELVLSFLQGLALDAYTHDSTTTAKWAICLDAPELLDDLQAVLTNLGVVHGRISKFNPKYGKTYDEVYAVGVHAKRIVELAPFLEAHKSAAATRMAAGVTGTNHNTADVVPGITPAELYALVPYGAQRGRRPAADRIQLPG